MVNKMKSVYEVVLDSISAIKENYLQIVKENDLAITIDDKTFVIMYSPCADVASIYGADRNGVYIITIDPNVKEKLSHSEIAFIVCHEIAHTDKDLLPRATPRTVALERDVDRRAVQLYGAPKSTQLSVLKKLPILILLAGGINTNNIVVRTIAKVMFLKQLIVRRFA